MFPRPLYNNIIVRVEKEYEDSLPFAGKELLLDTTYEPHRHRRTFGIVEQVPVGLNKQTIISSRMSGAQELPVYLDQIVPEVQVGDKVYFDYLCLLPVYKVSDIIRNDIHVGGQFLVSYDKIICVVRDGKIKMIGGHVLVKPEMQTNLSLSGIFISRWENPKPLRGKVAHIGTPLKCDDDLGLQAGDPIVFTVNSDILRRIEGIEYYVMQQIDIIAKESEVAA